jgi:hypothetical protein
MVPPGLFDGVPDDPFKEILGSHIPPTRSTPRTRGPPRPGATRRRKTAVAENSFACFGKRLERRLDIVGQRIGGQINDIDSRRQAPEDRHDLPSIGSPHEPEICAEHNHDSDAQFG